MKADRRKELNCIFAATRPVPRPSELAASKSGFPPGCAAELAVGVRTAWALGLNLERSGGRGRGEGTL